MFHKVWTAGLVVATALSSLSFASADDPKSSVGARQITNSIGMKLTLIPSGEFMMGNGESEEATDELVRRAYKLAVKGGYSEERPQHRVRITKPFYLGTYHVTRGQFRQFVKETGYVTDAEKKEESVGPKVKKPSRFKPRGPGGTGWNSETKHQERSTKFSWRNTGFEQTDDHPVVNVSWNDAMAFCKWLARKEGKKYRLPTEAEWEYACRAGTTTRYSSGDDPDSLVKVGNLADATKDAIVPNGEKTIKASDGFVFTAPVGSFKPNAFGLYDMHGNAWQWCADRFSYEYYAESPTDDPPGPASIELLARVVRGGSWAVGGLGARCAVRYWRTSESRTCDMGFRVARTK